MDLSTKVNIALLALITTPVIIYCIGLVCYGLIDAVLNRFFDL